MVPKLRSWILQLEKHIPRNFHEWVHELKQLAETKLPVQPPFHMRRGLLKFPEREQKECKNLYRLCVDAQNGRFDDSEWNKPLYMSKYFLRRQMFDQFLIYLKTNAWIIIPEIDTKQFQELMAGIKAEQSISEMAEFNIIQPGLRTYCCTIL